MFTSSFTVKHPVIQEWQNESSSFAPLLYLNLLVSTSCLADVFCDFSARFAHNCKKKKLAVGSVQYSFAEAKLPNPLKYHSHLSHFLLVRNTLHICGWDSTQAPGRSLHTWDSKGAEWSKLHHFPSLKRTQLQSAPPLHLQPTFRWVKIPEYQLPSRRKQWFPLYITSWDQGLKPFGNSLQMDISLELECSQRFEEPLWALNQGTLLATHF